MFGSLRKVRDHFLIVGDAVPIEHGNHHRSKLRLGVELAEHRKRRLQPRHADGKPRRRHRLAAKARDEAIIPSAAADRAEANGAAFFVFGFEQ